jgi:hypothetical protein
LVCDDFSSLLAAMVEVSHRLVNVFHSAPLVSISLLLPSSEVSASMRPPTNIHLPPSTCDMKNGDSVVTTFEVPAQILVSKTGEWPLPECMGS